MIIQKPFQNTFANFIQQLLKILDIFTYLVAVLFDLRWLLHLSFPRDNPSKIQLVNNIFFHLTFLLQLSHPILPVDHVQT